MAVLKLTLTVLLTLTLFRGYDSVNTVVPISSLTSISTNEDSAFAMEKLPSDMQITTSLRKGEHKLFYYWSEILGSPLSITVTPCMSTIRWTVYFKNKNNTNIDSDLLLGTFTTKQLYTYHLTSSRGIFLLHLEAIDLNGSAAIYVSTEPGGPQVLQMAELQPPLRLMNRQRRRQLTVRWNQSLVDPHGTNYCLVISQKRNFSSLCEAMTERFGSLPSELVIPKVTRRKSRRAMQKITNWEKSKGLVLSARKDPIIACVESQTQFTMSNLEHGTLYYLNLFAINKQTNFTYAYGSSVLKFNSHIKPTALKDGKPAFINLKKVDGKAVFRFKVARASTEPLRLYVMPCGGAVDVEVTLKTTPVEQRRRIDGYGKIIIKNPIRGQRYYIRVIATNREELKRTSGVEVLASTKSSPNFPLPNMPVSPQVYEYNSMRRCDSVTVGWLPSPEQSAAHYCLVVREGRLRELDGYRMPNQCGLENRLKKSADFAVKYCLNIKKEKSEVITQKISHLKPGRSYVIQVTVRKSKGKTLSYDLLQVHTKPYCEHSKQFD